MPMLTKFISAEHSVAYRKPISRLLLLRTLSIVVQLLSLLVIYLTFDKVNSLGTIFSIVVFESVFHLASVLYFSRVSASNLALTLQILADITFISLLLLQSGGATNAFVSL